MAKLWDKGFNVNEKIERFTVGKDRELDLYLAPWDILGTMAHITMLQSVGLLGKDELDILLAELKILYKDACKGDFTIGEGVEDVHSQVELTLTGKLGDIGKKVHTGRSRNDQVMLDIKLFSRAGIERTAGAARKLFGTLTEASERYRDKLMPGYTHMQVAMPSSFGLWLGAYAESLADDMESLLAAWNTVNRNPLGSAAGYGSTAPLDRSLTTSLLGFEDLDYNSIYAQMGRGKTERNVAFALSCIAETIGKLAADCCLFNSQNFAFVTLPREMTTGSSIMPHKKNPDVFELIRAHCNRICSVPESIRLLTTNLSSGYFRDLQLLKELYLPVFDELCDCLEIMDFAIGNLEVKDGLMDDPRYAAAFSVEEVNRLTASGIPFRDAYRQVGEALERGEFKSTATSVEDTLKRYTHEGSIGNLCTDRICARMDRTMARFPFDKVRKALEKLAD
ncbi:MAG: argininosuccinate lyase [Bacteroidales bacterium]|nr:argininosuccinate lyase [Bacteroidales bacterium]